MMTETVRSKSKSLGFGLRDSGLGPVKRTTVDNPGNNAITRLQTFPHCVCVRSVVSAKVHVSAAGNSMTHCCITKYLR